MAESMTTWLTTWVHNIMDKRREKISGRAWMCYMSLIINIKLGLVAYLRDLLIYVRGCAVVEFLSWISLCVPIQLKFVIFWIDHVSLCSDFYLKDSLLHAYEEPIILVGDMSSWVIPKESEHRKYILWLY